jgi:hypothetical protein
MPINLYDPNLPRIKNRKATMQFGGGLTPLPGSTNLSVTPGSNAPMNTGASNIRMASLPMYGMGTGGTMTPSANFGGGPMGGGLAGMKPQTQMPQTQLPGAQSAAEHRAWLGGNTQTRPMGPVPIYGGNDPNRPRISYGQPQQPSQPRQLSGADQLYNQRRMQEYLAMVAAMNAQLRPGEPRVGQIGGPSINLPLLRM